MKTIAKERMRLTFGGLPGPENRAGMFDALGAFFTTYAEEAKASTMTWEGMQTLLPDCLTTAKEIEDTLRLFSQSSLQMFGTVCTLGPEFTLAAVYVPPAPIRNRNPDAVNQAPNLEVLGRLTASFYAAADQHYEVARIHRGELEHLLTYILSAKPQARAWWEGMKNTLIAEICEILSPGYKTRLNDEQLRQVLSYRLNYPLLCKGLNKE